VRRENDIWGGWCLDQGVEEAALLLKENFDWVSVALQGVIWVLPLDTVVDVLLCRLFVGGDKKNKTVTMAVSLLVSLVQHIARNFHNSHLGCWHTTSATRSLKRPTVPTAEPWTTCQKRNGLKPL